MTANVPSDVKTYTVQEAKAEWDGARESKRRMFLARIDMRESDLALKSWDEFSASEHKQVHIALNGDFVSPVWYINTKGQRINLTDVPTIQKSVEQLADEEGEQRWERMSFEDRFNTLLANGIGRDAEQGQYAQWRHLSPDLRVRLGNHFEAKETVSETAVEPLAQEVSRQLALF